MNDKWLRHGDERWNDAERIRIARRFRHHVRSPSNPRGRIHREMCFFCSRQGEAHHVDYSRPFVVAWLCFKHHRDVDHGALKIPVKAIHDYTSLVANISKLALRAENRPVARATGTEGGGEVPPF